MFEKVLIPTDFSEYSKMMLEYCAELAKLGVKEVVLAHIVDSSAFDILKATVWQHRQEEVERAVNEAISEAKKLIEEEAKLLKDFDVKTIVRFGSPAEEIAKIADEEDVSLIYMGSRGRNWLAARLLGDVAEEVAMRVNKPIMFTRFAVVEENGKRKLKVPFESPFEKILYATDFSEKVAGLKDIVKEMALQGGRKVVLVAVAESIHYMLESLEYEDIKERAEKLRDEFEKAGLFVKLYVERGTASREILRIADREIPSLIALGAVGVGGAKGLGGTADNVLRRAETTVFIYK